MILTYPHEGPCVVTSRRDQIRCVASVSRGSSQFRGVEVFMFLTGLAWRVGTRATLSFSAVHSPFASVALYLPFGVGV